MVLLFYTQTCLNDHSRKMLSISRSMSDHPENCLWVTSCMHVCVWIPYHRKASLLPYRRKHFARWSCKKEFVKISHLHWYLEVIGDFCCARLNHRIIQFRENKRLHALSNYILIFIAHLWNESHGDGVSNVIKKSFFLLHLFLYI